MIASSFCATVCDVNASTVARAELDELISLAGTTICEQVCDRLVNEHPAVALDCIRFVASSIRAAVIEVGAKVRKPGWYDGVCVEVVYVGQTHFMALDEVGRDYVGALSERWERAS